MAMITLSMMSLKRQLEREHALIPVVAQVWEVSTEGMDTASAITRIVEHMEDEHVARSVWERLSPSERLCLFHLFGSGDPNKHNGITLENLREKTQLSSEAVKEAVESLRARWYLVDAGTTTAGSSLKSVSHRLELTSEQEIFPYRECFQQLWQTGQEIFGSQTLRSSYSLERLVETFTGDRLRYLANLCHVPLYYEISSSYYSYKAYTLSAARTKEIHALIYEALCHPLMPFHLLHHLELSARDVFFWLCEQGGNVKMTEVRSYMDAHALGSFHALVAALEAYALAFDTLTSDGTRLLFTPSEVVERVNHEAENRAEDERRYALRPIEDVTVPQESQPLLLYDLASVVGLSMQMIIEPTKEGRLPKRLREKIRPFLHGAARRDDEGTDVYTDQIFRTARALGLLESIAPAEEEKPRYLCGPKLEQWSQLTKLGQAQELVKWWRATSSWFDTRFDGRALPSPPAVHQLILDQLKQCLPDRWYPFDAVLYGLWQHAPLSLFDSYSRKLIEPEPLSAQREAWMERAAMTYISPLASILTELGLVSVAPEHDRFYITSFGAAVLELVPTQPDASVQDNNRPLLILQPNYEMLLMEFDISFLYKLLSMAELVRIGMVSTFRLTQPALLIGLASGLQLEDILTLLTSHTAQHVLPQNVDYTIKDWAKSYREFHLSEMILIETPENETLESVRRLLANSSGKVRHVGPGLFLVPSTGSSTFGSLHKRLRQAGIVVKGEPSSVSSKRS